MRKRTEIKSALVFGVITVAGLWGTYAIAPERRHGTPADWEMSSDVPKLLPPMRMLSQNQAARPVVEYDAGSPPGTTKDDDGGTAYEDGTPATLVLGYVRNGAIAKSGDGKYIGRSFPVPSGCEVNAKALVGHGILIPKIVWRMPDGSITISTKANTVSRAICDAKPDAAVDEKLGIAAVAISGHPKGKTATIVWRAPMPVPDGSREADTDK